MGSLWLFYKKLVFICALLLATASWHTEAQAQSAGLLITWTDTSNNEDGFKIERLMSGLVDATLSVPANTASYIDSALVAGTVYCYRVEAFNSAGDSGPSNQACATAQNPTLTVSAGSTTITPGGTITVSWSGIATPTTTDWIGLYAPGAADTNFINRIYVSCSTTPGSARASGSCPYVLPATLSTGNYELRLFTNGGLLSGSATLPSADYVIYKVTSISGGCTDPQWASAPMIPNFSSTNSFKALWVSSTNRIHLCGRASESSLADGSSGSDQAAIWNESFIEARWKNNQTAAYDSNTFYVAENASRNPSETAGTYDANWPSGSFSAAYNANIGGSTRTFSGGVWEVYAYANIGFTPTSDQIVLGNFAMFKANGSSASIIACGSDQDNLPTACKVQFSSSTVPNSTRLATTSSFTVTTPGITSQTASLTVSPAKVMAGASVTAIWTGITAPTPKDWIGLYASGTADTKFINWMYVSCSANAGTARASGSCIYLLPATLSAGNYELRLFANDGFMRIATGNILTVSASSNTTPIVLANATSTNNGSSTGLLPQVSREWTDYDLRVNLRSMNTNSIGVMFRYRDDRNYYRFVWNQKSKFRRLEKIENGTATVLASDTVGYVKGRTYQSRIIVQGTTLRVFIDGAQIFSVDDSTFAEGTVGLYSSANQSSFDNVVVQDLSTGSVLLSRDFDDGTFTGWTIVDQGSKHGPSAWSATSGSLLQSSNIDGTFALYIARSWTDYRFAAKLRSLDKGAIGVMFRYQGSNEYYRFAWDARAGVRRLEKVQNGALTVLAKDAIPYITGTTYNLEIAAKGTTIGVQIDGKLVFSVVDPSLTEGTVALYSSYNPGSSFDDVSVQDLVTGAILLADDFNDGTFTGWTIVDEGSDQRPSAWSVKAGSFLQSSNIGSNSSNNLGTYALY